ncbi:MAG: radical SAM protein [Myxococcales bacterium]|nr:radical SAM protein [Myxococcales bacterium]
MQRIELGFVCNNRCVFCAQGSLGARAGDDPTDPLAARVEAALGALRAGEPAAFVGGEPTLHDALPLWLAEAARRGAAPLLLVQTNGRRLAYLAYARSLAAVSPALGLEVSLQGQSAAMHDYHTSTPGSFAQTVKGLRHARALGVPFALTTVVTRSSFRHLAEFVRLARHLGARSLSLARAARHGRAAAAADRVIPNDEVVAPYLEAARDEARLLGLPLFDAAHPPESGALHAGIGVVEPSTPEPEPERGSHESPTPGAAPRRLPLAKPLPARAEERGPARRSGEELRRIFPGLFGDAEAEAQKPPPPKG